MNSVRAPVESGVSCGRRAVMGTPPSRERDPGCGPKCRISAMRSTFYTRHSLQPSMRIYCELKYYKIVKVRFCLWLGPSFTWFVGHFAEDQLDIRPKLFVFGKLGDLMHIESFKHQNFRIHPGFFSNRKPDFIVDLASLENHR